MDKQPKRIRDDLVDLLRGTNAHMAFEEVVERFPEKAINTKAPHVPYAPWHLVEHMRIAQGDILEFIRNPDHVSPDYPDGYRPHPRRTADRATWHASVKDFIADRTELERMIGDPKRDLFAPLPHAPAYTLYQEILTASSHASYHIGELAMLRQVLQAWPPDNPYLTREG
jgi:hypothetical protein